MSRLAGFSTVTRQCAHCWRAARTVGFRQSGWRASLDKTSLSGTQQVVPARAAAVRASVTSVDALAPSQVTYEAVIGLETHVQLATRSKAFCSCANEYGAPPNSLVCPVCTAQPGALPVLNEACVRLGIIAGLALNCSIAAESKFDRKQYFYADLPKGYQISQYDEPLAKEGSLEIVWLEDEKRGKKMVKATRRKTIRITRIHLEEDAGKNTHAGNVGMGVATGRLSGSAASLVDLNRAGVPLLEVVTEPDFRSGVEAAAYGEELRRVVRFLGISDGNMQEGSMRCDVNVSVRRSGAATLGTKVEIKNMNSFSGMQRAIDAEVARQTALLESGRGEEIVLETRTFDAAAGVTVSMRRKEGLADYRYFPEPDLPPLLAPACDVAAARASMAELPAALRSRLAALGVPVTTALVIAEDVATARYYDAAVARGGDPVQVANWVARDLLGWCKERGVRMDDAKMSPASLAEVIGLIADGTISSKGAKELTPDLLEGAAEGAARGGAGGPVAALVRERGLGQISDEAQIGAVVDAVLAANPKQVEQYRGGKTKLQGYFQGQAMKESGGRVNPELLAKILKAKLDGPA